MHGCANQVDGLDRHLLQRIADNITFDFSSQHIMLPNTLVYGISYNTDHYGPNPIGGSTSPDELLERRIHDRVLGRLGGL